MRQVIIEILDHLINLLMLIVIVAAVWLWLWWQGLIYPAFLFAIASARNCCSDFAGALAIADLRKTPGAQPFISASVAAITAQSR